MNLRYLSRFGLYFCCSIAPDYALMSTDVEARSLQSRRSRLLHYIDAYLPRKVALYCRKKKSPGKGGRREIFFSSARLTSPNDTKEKNNGGGLYPADPKGRRLAPCDFVCKATRSPRARRRDNSEQTQGLPPTKGSWMAASEKPRRTSTPIPSLINIKSNTKRRRACTH